MQPTVTRHRFTGNRLPVIFIRNIQVHENRSVPQFLCQCLTGNIIDVGDHNFRAMCGQQPTIRFTETFGTACHDGHFSFYPTGMTHGVPPKEQTN